MSWETRGYALNVADACGKAWELMITHGNTWILVNLTDVRRGVLKRVEPPGKMWLLVGAHRSLLRRKELFGRLWKRVETRGSDWQRGKASGDERKERKGSQKRVKT